MPYTAYSYCNTCPAVRLECLFFAPSSLQIVDRTKLSFVPLLCCCSEGVLLSCVLFGVQCLPWGLLLPDGVGNVLRVSCWLLLPIILWFLHELPWRDILRVNCCWVLELPRRPVPEFSHSDWLQIVPGGSIPECRSADWLQGLSRGKHGIVMTCLSLSFL